MNSKIKVIVMIGIFAAVIGGSLVLYRSLAGTYSADNGGIPAPQSAQDGDNKAPKQTKAPDFTVIDGTGKEIKLSAFRGKPVVVNFWASWCPPCRAEMPEFEKVAQEMDGKVVFLMVNMTDGARETEAKAKSFIAEHGFTFSVYYDTKQEAAYAYGITALPTTVFIDSNGDFIHGIRGGINAAELRKQIARIHSDVL